MFVKVFGLFLVLTWCHNGHASFFEPGCRAEINEMLNEKQMKLFNALNNLDKKTNKLMYGIEKDISDVKAKFYNLLKDFTNTPSIVACQKGWIGFENSCYFISKKQRNFDAAKETCEGKSANLVEIETDEENKFIQAQLRKDGGDKFWIGITDKKNEGTWLFADSGKPVSLLEWGNSQPNNGYVSNCGAIWKSFNYYFVDEPCTNNFRFICEM